MVSLLNAGGLLTKVERGRRVFPLSDKSADVLATLVRLIRKTGVRVKYGMDITSIRKNDGVFTIGSDKESETADAVIIATGGLSYPKTGSNGGGYLLARNLGHQVTTLKPSLTALVTKEDFGNLSGLTLKNTAITLKDNDNKTVYTDFGEMVFTHFGVSGPIILSASAMITERLGAECFNLFIDLKPALDEITLDKRILRDFGENRNKDIINALGRLLPKSLIQTVVELAGVPLTKKVNSLTKDERHSLVNTIKALPMTITGTDGFDHAVITRGGVEINEINPKTMESKLVRGLYFAGEIIDADAYTGGYNLQIAFSTGYLAGRSASEMLE